MFIGTEYLNTGVYKITNLINKKVYVGSASGPGGFKYRWSKKYNKVLEAAFEKYR